MNEIKSNTCPYCGAAYTLAAGGCVQQCIESELCKKWIQEAAAADEMGFVYDL